MLVPAAGCNSTSSRRRVVDIDDDRESLVGDLDEFGRVRRGCDRVGNDRRERLAHEAHTSTSKELTHHLGVEARKLGRLRVEAEVLRGDDRHDAGCGRGPGDVEVADQRVSDRCADEDQMAGVEVGQVGRVLTQTLQKAEVLHYSVVAHSPSFRQRNL